MNDAHPRSLPPAVLEAVRRGNLIEAIKLLRASGIGLREAKEAIEAHGGRRVTPASTSFPFGSASQPLPPDVVNALQKGNKIEAVRLMREQSGLGLKESREAVEAYERTRPLTIGELSPGQVSETGSGIWWIVTLALVCLAAFLILRRVF